VDDDFDDDFPADDDDEFDGDYVDDEDEPTIACPYCREPIHEDAQRCPHCESYISAEDAPPARKPWWIVIGVIICLYIVYRWIVGVAR
jgi:hypothetical protein